jgi:hypothetical protein
MNTRKKIFKIAGWIFTILNQAVMGYLTIFLFSVMGSTLLTPDNTSWRGWLINLLVVWLGFGIGVFSVGALSLNLGWSGSPKKYRARLIGTVIGGLIPILVLIGIRLAIAPSGTDSQFQEVIANQWQPRLTTISLLTGLLGFYLPGWMGKKD